jgi:hypothetical protein
MGDTQERILAELRDIGHTCILTAEDAITLSGAIRRVEAAHHDRHNWNSAPELYLIRTPVLGERELPLTLTRIRVTNKAWGNTNPGDVLTTLAARATMMGPGRRREMLDADVARAVLIGALLIAEGWQVRGEPPTPGKIGRHVRVVNAVDVDGRVYQVVRCCDTDQVTRALMTAKEYALACTETSVAPRPPGDVLPHGRVVGGLTAIVGAFRERALER